MTFETTVTLKHPARRAELANMSMFLVIGAMFALPLAFAAGLFFVARFGAFFGLPFGTQGTQEPTPPHQLGPTHRTGENRSYNRAA